MNELQSSLWTGIILLFSGLWHFILLLMIASSFDEPAISILLPSDGVGSGFV